jgi:hypothetical protein
MNFIGSGLVFVFFLASQGAAQNAKTPYPNPSMATVSQYLMPPRCRDLSPAEATPKSITGDAEILCTPSVLVSYNREYDLDGNHRISRQF